MINTKELEKRWYKYKAKMFTLFFLILGIVIMLPYLIYYIYTHTNHSEKSPSSQTPLVQPATVSKEDLKPSVNSKSDKPRQEPTLAPRHEEVVLAPTIPIVDMEEERVTPRHTKKHRVVPKKHLVKAKKATALSAEELRVIQGKDLNKEKPKINFKRSSANYIEVMTKKFKQNENPREALLLAKAYYQEKHYLKAEKWSLIANDLDKNSEESWLIFAKSKVKLGKRREALKILASYYTKSKSSRAKELIEKIKSRSL